MLPPLDTDRRDVNDAEDGTMVTGWSPSDMPAGYHRFDDIEQRRVGYFDVFVERRRRWLISWCPMLPHHLRCPGKSRLLRIVRFFQHGNSHDCPVPDGLLRFHYDRPGAESRRFWLGFVHGNLMTVSSGSYADACGPWLFIVYGCSRAGSTDDRGLP